LDLIRSDRLHEAPALGQRAVALLL
jgi:hypothetical protein